MALKGKIKNGKVVLGRGHKYKARPKVIDCIYFDSTREADRYVELKSLVQCGEITRLHVHPTFEIIWPGTQKKICMTELDFAYTDRHGKRRIEDVKGAMTALSGLKRKLVEAAHGIKVEIVR